ncbi:DMT family transporter [Paraburkholderia sp. MPAMCS5]|uniref:DMT family transporter n=1 Tax=Paraburkholderia sp. MPAMCS5 TaxID=3112563 RepID=UPI003FA77D11
MNSELSGCQQQRPVSDGRIGQLCMLLAMSISGTIGYFVILSGQRPFNVVFFRCAIGSVGLSAYCYFRGYLRSFRLSRKGLAILVLGALALMANWCFLFTAYRLTSVGITTVVYSVQPFLLLIAEFFILRKRASGSALTWLVLAFVGLIVLAQPGALNKAPSYLTGISCALMAAMPYATTTLLTSILRLTPLNDAAQTTTVATGASPRRTPTARARSKPPCNPRINPPPPPAPAPAPPRPDR